MIKFLVILLLFGALAAQEAPTSGMRRGLRSGNRGRIIQRIGSLASLVRRPRLSKRNSPEALPSISSFGAKTAVNKLRPKFRKSFVGKRGKARPSRGLKYYFSLATPNGDCGCGGTGGGGGKNVNCKCDKIIDKKDEGKP